MTKGQRAKYATLAKHDQNRYAQELQSLTFGAGEKPIEPVRARTPYMFFVREARNYVNKERKDVLKRDIMLEVGRLWNVVKSGQKCGGVNNIEYYKQLAKQDLERFKSEHAQFVNGINQLRHSNLKLEDEEEQEISIASSEKENI